MGRIAGLYRSLILLSACWAQIGYLEEGEASYYAASFEGLRTASGERYSRKAFTAAHRTLPFGTMVKVTHLASGRITVVRINDRGPFKVSRIIDLSEAAARELGILQEGIARVRLEVVERPQPPVLAPSPYVDLTGKPITLPSGYGVQIGAFTLSENAYVVAKNAQAELRGELVFLWRASYRGKVLYRVIVGSYAQRSAAGHRRDQLKRAGWQAFVVSLSHGK